MTAALVAFLAASLLLFGAVSRRLEQSVVTRRCYWRRRRFRGKGSSQDYSRPN